MREDIIAVTNRELERYQVLRRYLRKEVRQAEAAGGFSATNVNSR